MDYSTDWRRGTPLADAWFRFAPLRMRTEYNRYERGDINGRPRAPESIDRDDPEEMRRLLLELPGQVLEHIGLIQPDVYWQMMAAVLASIQRGTLIALGIAHPRHDAQEELHQVGQVRD